MPFNYYVPGLRPSSNLEQHLMGLDRSSPNPEYTEDNAFLMVALLMIALNVLALVNYYYWIFNRHAYSKRIVWFLHVIIIAAIVAAVAYNIPFQALRTNNVNPSYPFTTSDCISFALESAVISIVISIITSALIKWWSRSNKYIPF